MENIERKTASTILQFAFHLSTSLFDVDIASHVFISIQIEDVLK